MIDPTHRVDHDLDMTETTRGPEGDAAAWPILRAAQDIDCDGVHPKTGRNCVLGHHQGYHRDDTGAEWLDH